MIHIYANAYPITEDSNMLHQWITVAVIVMALSTSSTLSLMMDKKWSAIRNACIKGNNYRVHKRLTLVDCKEKCVKEAGINCQSIEYNPVTQMCSISGARSDSDQYAEPCLTNGWEYTELIIDQIQPAFTLPRTAVGVTRNSAYGGGNNTSSSTKQPNSIVNPTQEKCNHEHKEYNVGDVVRIIPYDCLMFVCRADNDIEEVKPLGMRARKCCVCHNKLYGRTSHTCKTHSETGKCPVPCHTASKECSHGEVLGTDLGTCSRRRCMNGVITLEYPLGQGMTGCCLETSVFGMSEEMVAPGSVVSNGGCLTETCTNGVWVVNSKKISRDCAVCKIFNDPHFKVFSGAIFDWHIGCNHALVQEGTSMNPEFGVFMDFKRRGRISVISGPTTYQEDRNTRVVLHPGIRKVSVNGFEQPISSRSPTFLVGPGGTKTTVMAWKHGSCIRLYGKPKILVSLCRSSITIHAAKWSLGQKPLGGLCGSTATSALKARKLVDRQGTEHTNPGRQRSAAAAFGYSWQAAQQTKAGCPAAGGGAGRRKRDTQEEESEKGREEACLDTNESKYLSECNEVFTGVGLTGADRDMLFNACLFDLCTVTTDPEIGITVEEMLQQHKEIAAETKDEEDNTIDFVFSESKCPAGWSPIVGKCCQVHVFSDGINLYTAQDHCLADDATLAEPRDLKATQNFLMGSLPFLKLPSRREGGQYWMGGRYTNGNMEWLVGGGVIPNDRFMIGRASLKKPYDCVDLKPTYKLCVKPTVYICEKEPLACGDEDDECAWRAADGECNGNRHYMYNFCKASCKVPCDCDQPDTCTEIGGMCQPMGVMCDAVSDSTLCSAGNCTCCYVPDPCQDSGNQDCESLIEQGYCEAEEEYVFKEMEKHCSRSCGFCEPLY